MTVPFAQMNQRFVAMGPEITIPSRLDLLKIAIVLLTFCFEFLFDRTCEASAADGSIPSFTAEGIVSTECFGEDSSAPIRQVTGKFVFSYDQGVWEIQIGSQSGQGLGIDPSSLAKSVLNCKRIPDGIRSFVTKSTNLFSPSITGVRKETAATLAKAEPIPFPPPGDTGLLICWFSLCPNPELPLIDATLTRRFLSVSLFDNRENVGTYSKTYLEPGRFFLWTFNITNNGVEFISDAQTIKQEPPFDRGYSELAFEVREATNINGISIPVQTVLYQYAPRSNAKKSDEVYGAIVARVQVKEFRFGAPAPLPIPPKILADDHRPANLREKGIVPYVISNDTWASLSNSQVSLFADISRERGRSLPGENRRLRRFIVITVFAVSLIGLPAWFLAREQLIKTRTTNKTKTNKNE